MNDEMQEPLLDLRAEIYRRYSELHFGDIHKDLDREFRQHRVYLRANIGRYLPTDPGTRIVDLGCGLGHVLSFLRAEGFTNILGVDGSADSVDACRSRGLPAEKADIFDWLPGQRADVLIATDLLEHLTEPELGRFLSLAHGALRSGGRLIVKVPNAANPVTGCSSIYLDFTHQRSFTDLSLRSVLRIWFPRVHIFGQNLFVFYWNPLNYVGLAGQFVFDRVFRLLALLYGQRETRIFKKSIIAVADKA